MIKKKRAFTLVEVLIVLFIFWVGVLTIVQGINQTTKYISDVTQKTIALNLAKEGIEAVYNIRDTNRRRRSSQRDACWLNTKPFEECSLSPTFSAGNRVISQDIQARNFAISAPSVLEMNQIPSLVSDSSVLMQWFKANDFSYPPSDTSKAKPFVLHLYAGDKSERISQDRFQHLATIDQKVDTSRWVYWRILTFSDPQPKDANCTDLWCAYEVQFCSTVVYTQPYQGVVNICALMTNYLP